MEASTGAVVGFFAVLIAIAASQGWSAISPGVVTVLFVIYVLAWLLGSCLVDWWRYREKWGAGGPDSRSVVGATRAVAFRSMESAPPVASVVRLGAVD